MMNHGERMTLIMILNLKLQGILQNQGNVGTRNSGVTAAEQQNIPEQS